MYNDFNYDGVWNNPDVGADYAWGWSDDAIRTFLYHAAMYVVQRDLDAHRILIEATMAIPFDNFSLAETQGRVRGC